MAFGNGAAHSAIIGKKKTHSGPTTSFNSVPDILRRFVVEGDLRKLLTNVAKFFFRCKESQRKLAWDCLFLLKSGILQV
jgi:hypothetical protein